MSAIRALAQASPLLMLALGLGCHAPTPSPADSPRDDVAAPTVGADAIVFVTDGDDGREIHAVRGDGSMRQRIYRTAGDAYPAGVRHDGALLVLRTDGDDEAHREQLTVLGQSVVDLPLSARFVRRPSFDGEAVIAESSHFGFRDIVKIDDHGIERLTQEPSGCFEPAAHGRSVAFVSSKEGDPEIYKLQLPSLDWQRLTWSRGEDSQPSWSPDGRQIAFVSERRGAPNVYVMGADGSRPTALASGCGPSDRAGEQRCAHSDLRWSPDGRHVAFIERVGSRAGLRVVRVADRVSVFPAEGDRADPGDWVDQTPAWSPDGTYLAFASNRGGDTDLYRARADGSELHRLTNSEGAEWLPQWLPSLPGAARSN